MFIVRVIPVAKGVFKGELSFFSRDDIAEGSLVFAPIRGKNTPTIVVSSHDVREEKSSIRGAGFTLKKIPGGTAKRVLRKPFIEAMQEAALWHGASEGAMLAALTSQVILASAGKLASAEERKKEEGMEPEPRADLLVLQAEKEERVRTYRNLAREAFARGASVLVIAPTVIEAETLSHELERGIESQVVLLTGELSKKKLIDSWNRVMTDTKPLLIVGTAFALSAPRASIDTVIVERESARAYRGINRPHADVRRVTEFFCRRTGARLIVADFPLRVETRYRVDIGEMEELSRSQSRTESGETEIVDVRAKDATKELGGNKGNKRIFKTISDETLKKIEMEIKRGGRVAVFAARKGIAPLTVCNDCGTPVTDEESVPMTLYKTAEGNMFISHRSGALVAAGTACRTCGSWNLVTLGIGIERVFQELQKSLPDVPLYLFTKDTAPTHKSAKKLSEEFFKTEGAAIAGTERMLPYLTDMVGLSVVASVDSILSLPAWRSHEHALSILFYLRERAEHAAIVETRKPEHLVMKTIQSGNPAEFYRTEIEERKQYQYPPFSTFIGLSWRGARAAVEKMRLLVETTFKDDDLVGPLPAISDGKNEWSARAVIRLQKGAWPSAVLTEKLNTLPPAIAVTIDPDEIA